MNLNLSIIFGRLLVVLSIIVGAINLNWYQGLQPTTAEVMQAEAPCRYHSGKGPHWECDFRVRYATRDGVMRQTAHTAGSNLPVGSTVEGQYHPEAPDRFIGQEPIAWKLVPFLLFLLGTFTWLAGNLHLQARQSEHDLGSVEGNSEAAWVQRLERQLSEAKARSIRA